jgi:hypothetical protein
VWAVVTGAISLALHANPLVRAGAKLIDGIQAERDAAEEDAA